MTQLVAQDRVRGQWRGNNRAALGLYVPNRATNGGRSCAADTLAVFEHVVSDFPCNKDAIDDSVFGRQSKKAFVLSIWWTEPIDVGLSHAARKKYSNHCGQKCQSLRLTGGHDCFGLFPCLANSRFLPRLRGCSGGCKGFLPNFFRLVRGFCSDPDQWDLDLGKNLREELIAS